MSTMSTMTPKLINMGLLLWYLRGLKTGGA